MQPAQGEVGGSGRMLRRWGPVAAIVVVVALVAALVVLGGGDDEEATESGTGGTDSSAQPVEGVVTFSQAEEQGIEVDWPETCDTGTGRIAIPTNYAAECVAPFEGENGGATSNGVTGDSIKIVVYQSPPDPLTDAIFELLNVDDTDEQALETLQGFVDLYSSYYETYGRTVELVPFQGTATSIDEVAARADAQTIVEEHDPFMVWGGPLLTDAFADELAANGVLNISLTATMADQYYADRDPSLWTILMTPEQNMLHIAEYVGKRLAGEPAEHAGDQLSGEERVFGLVSIEIGPDFDYLHQSLLDGAAEYGVEFAADVTYTDPVTLPSVAAQKVAELKEAGVTTVVFVGDPLAPKTLTEEATRQEYFPEWVVTGSYLVDSTAFARTYDQEQWAHAFGMSGLWARGLPEATFAYYLYEWFHGEPPPADNSVAVLFPLPTQLMAGIQMAGPDLTPDTFREALFAAVPIAGGLSNPGVSWGDHGYFPNPDYAALDDMTEIWWDPGATGPDERGDEGQGMYQYVDGGARYLPGGWPDTPPRVFDPDGAVALYTELPETDAADDYPPPDR